MGKFYKETRTINADGEPFGKNVRQFYSPFQEGRGYNLKYKSTVIRSYLDIELPKCFTDNECGKIYRLSKKIYSDSNLLAKRISNTVVPLSKQDIISVVGVHRVNFAPFWDKLIQNKIIKPIHMDNNEFFCFNPLYYNSTHYLPLYLYIAFQSELKDHLPEWVINKYLDMQDEPEKASK